MLGYRLRRFLDVWAQADRPTRVFLAWNAANTWLAFALLVGAVALLAVMSSPGFQRAILLSYIAVALLWLVSVFVIGPAYERVAPADADQADA
jgi:hypothetical protein